MLVWLKGVIRTFCALSSAHFDALFGLKEVSSSLPGQWERIAVIKNITEYLLHTIRPKISLQPFSP